jgi:hypothetical protein
MCDYVITGAGSGRCVLANRLSADPKVSVWVIEASPSDWFPPIHMPGAFGVFMLVGSNTNAPTIIIAERASDMMKRVA